MRCNEIRARLVAYRDHELSPGEGARVREHLAACSGCAAVDARLIAATPFPCVAPDPSGEAALWDRLDDAVARELERPRPPVRVPVRARIADWLEGDARVPRVAVLAYALALALSLGWGVGSWWSAPGSDAGAIATVPPEAVGEIPADEFRPASWAPPGDSADVE